MKKVKKTTHLYTVEVSSHHIVPSPFPIEEVEKMQEEEKKEPETQISGGADPYCKNGNLEVLPMEEQKETMFYQRLGEFHESAGLSLVSSYAKTVLDLFKLYTEVTTRGGFEQVTKDERWSEVACALDFSNSSSRPSLLLKDLYGNLLHRFEVIYFFGIQEKASEPPGSVLALDNIKKTSADHLPTAEDCITAKRKPHNSPGESSEGRIISRSKSLLIAGRCFSVPSITVSFESGTQVGNKVVGLIETEFDCGYLIKVTVGSENLNGVLYQNEDPSVKQFATVPSLMDGVGLNESDSVPVGLQVRVGLAPQEPKVGSSTKSASEVKQESPSKKKVKRVTEVMGCTKPEPKVGSSSKDGSKRVANVESALKKKVKDNNALKPKTGATPKKEVKKEQEGPRKPRSPYQIFLCQECERIKKMNKKARNVRQMVIDNWKALSDIDRQPYIEESQKDRERYDREMIYYMEHKFVLPQETEFKVSIPEGPSHDDYHVKLQLDENDRLSKPGGFMIDFAAELMENARKLDDTMQIGLDDEFLSVP